MVTRFANGQSRASRRAGVRGARTRAIRTQLAGLAGFGGRGVTRPLRRR